MYFFIFTIIGFITALFLAALTYILIMGIFWIFIFGDDPWPIWAQRLQEVYSLFVLIAVLLSSMYLGYRNKKIIVLKL